MFDVVKVVSKPVLINTTGFNQKIEFLTAKYQFLSNKMPFRIPLEPTMSLDGSPVYIQDPLIKQMCTFALIIKSTADTLDIDPRYNSFHKKLSDIYLMIFDMINIEDAKLKINDGYQPGPSSVPNLFGTPK